MSPTTSISLEKLAWPIGTPPAMKPRALPYMALCTIAARDDIGELPITQPAGAR
jgi:hypothetical protein